MSEMKKTAIERFMEERLLTKDYNFCFHGTRYEVLFKKKKKNIL